MVEAPVRRRLALESAVVLGALAIGAWRGHAAGGITLELIAFAVLLGALAAQRLLALAGLAPPGPRFVFALELAALAALVETPVATWGAVVASIAVTLSACPAVVTTALPAGRAERLALLAFALGTVAVVIRGWDAAHRAAPWAALPLGVLLLDAILNVPRPLAGDPSRQMSALALVAASALEHLHWGPPAFETEAVTLICSWVAASWAAIDAVARRGAGSGDVRLIATRRRVAFASVACGAALAVVWIAGEVVIRRLPASQAIHGPPSVDDGATFHVPNARYVFPGGVTRDAPEPRDLVRNEFTWNSEGFHDRDHARAKPAATVRVVFLGDSFVDGYQLRLEDLVHEQLARSLERVTPAPPAVEALAFATAGWCQRQELAVLRERALAYSPDLVILEFLPSNDVYENAGDLATTVRASQATLARFLSATARRRGLLFAGLVVERIDRAARAVTGSGDAHGRTDEVWREGLVPDRAALWESGWATTEALVREIADAVESNGARLVVVVFANESEVASRVDSAPTRPGFDFGAPSRRMAGICERRRVPCLELSGRLARRDAGTRAQMFLLGDGHWSSVGHRCAAEEIASFLTAETNIWTEIVQRARERR